MRRTIIMSGFICLVAVSAGPSWGESLDDAWTQAEEILAGHTGGNDPSAGKPSKSAEPSHEAAEDHFARYTFNGTAKVFSYTLIFAQQARITGSFEMTDTPNANNERIIRNLHYKIELNPEPADNLPGYTLVSMEPDSKPDFYPEDPKWKDRDQYAQQERGRIAFFINSRTAISAQARNTVLDAAVHVVPDGRMFGAKAILQLNPYCSEDMRSCSLGALSGIYYDHWGLGFFTHRIYPDFRMDSGTFSIQREKMRHFHSITF